MAMGTPDQVREYGETLFLEFTHAVMDETHRLFREETPR
jgi:hypothetical protein